MSTKRRQNDPRTGSVPVLMLTVDQAAEALQLGYYTTLRMIQDGEIAATKYGKEWRVPMAEIDVVIKDLMARSARIRAEKSVPAA